MAPNLILDDLNIPHPIQVFNRWVEDGTLRMLPVKFILEGNLVEAQHLTHQGAQLLNQMRRVNAFDLPQYNMAVDLPAGQKIRCSTNFGQETVRIYVPMLAGGAPLQKEKRTSQIIPAFEVTDVSGTALGWVLCLSGTWEPSYEFVSKKRASKELDLFEWGNWPAEYAEKPFEGIRKNKLFVAEPNYKLTDIAAHGEALAEEFTHDPVTVNPATSTDSGTISGPIYTRDNNGWAAIVWYSEWPFYYESTETLAEDVRDTDGNVINGSLCSKLTGDVSVFANGLIASFSAYADTPADPDDYGPLIAGYNSAVAAFDPSPKSVTHRPQQLTDDPDLGTYFECDFWITGNDLQYSDYQSTITDENGIAVLFAKQSSLYDENRKNTFNPDWDSLVTAETTTTTGPTYGYAESVTVDTENFPTINGSGEYSQDDVEAQDVHIRYYKVGDAVWVLVAIKRKGPDWAKGYGTRWQYGIYRSFADPKWVFNTEFTIPGDLGSAHIVPGLKGSNGETLYCDGVFRLVRKETYEAATEA